MTPALDHSAGACPLHMAGGLASWDEPRKERRFRARPGGPLPWAAARTRNPHLPAALFRRFAEENPPRWNRSAQLRVQIAGKIYRTRFSWTNQHRCHEPEA
ncbi:uncharacterized protein VTP21DRAFT_8455 [Calcarisporiella thermophila]|uniref:uncharacterized protein n=1 Tax=Calcarisporiella thermophila TaxID=911321 RepID=UPI00374393B5